MPHKLATHTGEFAVLPGTPIPDLRIGDRVRRTCQQWPGCPVGTVTAVDLDYETPYATVVFEDDPDTKGWSGTNLAWAREEN